MEKLTHHLQSMADTIDFRHIDTWLEDHVDIPIVAVVCYLYMVHVVPSTFMKSRPAYALRGLNIMWNLFLTAFSFCCFYYCAPRLAEIVWAERLTGLDPSALRYVANMTAAMKRNAIIPENFVEGRDLFSIRGSLDTSLCVWMQDIYRKNVCGLMCLLFLFSKIPEMLDTAFLVFQKKQIIFLHWYHHVTVMLYCWHAWITPTSSGLWFVVMNSFVHTIMYFYYFVCACGYRKVVRPFAPMITFLQILQMVVGSLIAVYVFARHAFGGGCDCSPANAKLALGMYSSYFYLFSKFFMKSYFGSGKGKKDKTMMAVANKEEESVKSD